MAEARLEAEEEPREFRELVILRNRRGQSNPATDHSERNKPERRLSQGPLSSLRAVIKRTSSRSSSQGDNARDRRRPEITIVSAEPLAANAWFPGASGGFTPAPPPAQPIWGGNIPAAAQPPPSYDQVIKEKTQEQVPPPVATPRHSTTIATQTDFLLEAGSECTASPQPAERKGFSVKRALKPPRPSLPKAKPEPDDTAVLADQPCPIPVEPFPVRTDTTSATNQQAAEAQPLPDHSCVTQSDPSPPLPVLCDETVEPFDHGLVSVDSPSEPIEADPASSRPQRPIPLPRSKPILQSISREVKVQTLVRIKDDGEHPQTALSQGGLPSGKYLQELLDVFCTDDKCYQGDPSDHTDPSDDGEQSEEDDIMSVSHSQRDIKAKIHAFEKQSATDAGDEAPLVKPEPRPRTQYSRPAVAAKPSFTRRPSGLWEQINASGSSMEQGQKEAVTPPTPAPRPLLPKASTEAEISEVPETQAGKVPLIPPSRSSVMARAKAFLAQEEGSAVSPPTPPPKIKPVTDPVSLTNHEKIVTLPKPPPKIKPAADFLNLANHGPEVTLPTPPPKLKPAMDPVSFTNHMPEFTLPTPPPKLKPAMDPVSFTNHVPEFTLPAPPPKLKPAMDPVSFTNHVPEFTLPAPPPKLKPAMDPVSFTNHVPEFTLPAPPPKLKPAADPLSLANYATPLRPSRPSMENGNGDRPVAQIPVKPQRSVTFGTNPPSASRKPTMIRVPSKADENESQEAPPALPFQRPIGGVPLPVMRRPSLISRPTHPPPVEPSNPEVFSFQPASTPVLSLPPRPVGSMVLPPRPPPAKAGPSRPPPPGGQGFPRSSSQAGREPTLPPRSQSFRGSVKRGPVQPPRPNPGHPLYNKYTLEIPHAIAEFDYNGSNTGELSFQKNEVLVLLEQMDRNTFECQVGDAKGPVQKSYLKIITPLSSASSMPSHQVLPSAEVRRGSSGLQAQALYDFTPESPEELALKAGDLVSMVERVDDEWCRGTARGSTGVFPVSFVRVLSTIPAPPGGQKAPPAPASVSGPRCVALFDFEGESSDELSFAEGDVIGLKEYIGEEWARGELNGHVGLFPLTFVEVVEDLPAPPPAQQNVQAKIPLPGMVSASKNHESARPTQLQSAPAGAEWGRAQYDFIAETDNDLPFQQGAVIQIMERVDAEWCRGRLDGRDGYFPATFVIPCPAPPGGTESQSGGGGGRARALFDFVPETEEELSLKAGDIITGVESIDDEWLLGELHGRRGLVPKNYVKVL
ncbi:SH3 domain-containing protein 19 isoform X1 [Anguilla rostrata]|uniref:SH3 domain-containing protein 19 isoform X1 n=1 Tax=Anguilla rostrata TaxID=7938 RepID=UPI0030CE827B